MERFGFIGDMIAAGIAGGVFPSAAAAVGIGDEPPFLHAAGRLALPAGDQANLATRYDMASVTKLMAAAMLALLALEAGTLTLEDPLSMFFDAPRDKAGITIGQLLAHTGGITPHFLLEDACAGPEDAVRAILDRALDGAPGDMPRYSCMGYILLGKILESVYGQPLDKAADAHVFGPLGMARTGYCPKGGNIAATEAAAGTGIPWQGIVHDENARFLGGISGNAGVFSDIRDCALFAAMLARGGAPLLAPATLRAAVLDRTPAFSSHRGLGFQLSGGVSFLGDLFPAAAFGHTGFTGTSIAVDPGTGLYAVLLTNRVHPTRHNDGITRFRRAFHNRIFAAVSRG
jgi:CubicO group peptidase (beta-lactamase class C family)